MKKITLILMLFLFSLVGCGKKTYKLSKLIPTSNITYVEYKTNKDAGIIYDESNYRTLTDDEKNIFISSLDTYKFKYMNDGYKGIFYVTFIIHYDNGDKISLDKVSIKKVDNKNNEVFIKLIEPVDCIIDDAMFKNN